jgi:hypothetical protein
MSAVLCLIPQMGEMLAWHIRKVRRAHFSSDRRVAQPISCGLTDNLALTWVGSVTIATLFAHFGPIDRCCSGVVGPKHPPIRHGSVRSLLSWVYLGRAIC